MNKIWGAGKFLRHAFLALALLPMTAFAAGSTTSAAQAVASPTAVAGSNSGANNQNITFQTQTPTDTVQQVNYGGSETVHNTPSMGAPNLTTSNDTCMGSAGGALSIAGFGGSIGSTYTDSNCIMLKNGRELWNQGMRAASMALECSNAHNRDALRKTGFSCIWTHGKLQPVEYDKNGLPVSYATQLAHVEGTTPQQVQAADSGMQDPAVKDPFIRYRMHLPPLPGQDGKPPYTKHINLRW